MEPRRVSDALTEARRPPDPSLTDRMRIRPDPDRADFWRVAPEVLSHLLQASENLAANRRKDTMTRLLALIGAVALCGTGLLAQAADPATGTWELNLSKSKYVPAATAPRSQTRTYRVEGNQDVAHHTGVDGQGNPTLIEFTATLDGKICPLKGYADWDAISMKKIDTYTTEFTQYRDGKASLVGKRVISKDGKTMTVTANGTSAKGEKVELLAVFDRVERGISR